MNAESVIKPLRPASQEWSSLGHPGHEITFGYPAEVFVHRRHLLSVISAVEVATDKDGVERGPEYHLSIARQSEFGPARCSADEAAWVLREFGLEGAEEDNHVPNGVVRNFWRTVAEPMIGLECGCKATEPVVREVDFEWRP